MAGAAEKIYSDALFELSENSDCVKRTYDELSFIFEVMEKNAELPKLLTLPTVTAEEKKKIVFEIFSDKLSELVFNFLNVLVLHGKAQLTGKIFAEFKNRYFLQQGILEVTAITVLPLDDNQRSKLVSKLESVSSKKIILVEKIDSSILGGIVIKYGNSQLDSSIKSRIDAMRKQINSIIA